MKKIIISVSMVIAAMAAVTGATVAYFSSKAIVAPNTFATGVLEVRVNGQPTIAGADFTAVAPGEEKVFTHNVNNYGNPWFAGPSNLTAKKLTVSYINPNDFGSGLWDQVYVKVVADMGPGTEQQVYWGKLKDMGNVNLLAAHWSAGLIPGNSINVTYTLWLPETGTDQSALMGKTLNWDFVIEGRTN